MAGDSPLARRLGIAALCVLALAASVGLAWWQWNRFESASGTFQNLGYVLQWPLFGLFPAFAVGRWPRRKRMESTTPAAPKLTPAQPVAKPAPKAQEPDAPAGELGHS